MTKQHRAWNLLEEFPRSVLFRHLKKLVLRIYWDDETTPSVETPLGDFFGLGLGEYHRWASELLSVGSDKALNAFFFMPFQKHARVTVSNEGQQKVDAFYFNLDYRQHSQPLPAERSIFPPSSARPNPTMAGHPTGRPM